MCVLVWILEMENGHPHTSSFIPSLQHSVLEITNLGVFELIFHNIIVYFTTHHLNGCIYGISSVLFIMLIHIYF